MKIYKSRLIKVAHELSSGKKRALNRHLISWVRPQVAGS
jgi:hypothetical protein